MTQQTAARTGTGYPVDDATYNLLQALTSKLEAIEAYRFGGSAPAFDSSD